jgi:hypothetical protein
MANYKEIKGVTVQTRDTDPVVNAGSWASGGSLNTARYRGGSSGTTTAGLVYTGRTPTYVGNTEQYNGTAWTELNDVNNNSYAGGGSPAGSYTAAIKSSGKSGPTSFQTNTEIWDGTNWTEVNNNNTGRDGIMGAGTSTSNIIAGGQTPPNQVIAESWDGTSWTEVGDLNNAKGFTTSWGSSNSNAIVATGEGDGSSPDGQGNTAETWNGSSWTATTSLNTGRSQAGAFGSTSTNGIVAAGYIGTGYAANCESFDGSAWTEVNNTSNNLGLHFGSGTDNQAGFVAGGNPVPSVGTQTEEWAFPPVTQDKLKEGMIFLSGGTTLKGFGKAGGVPTSTWSSGGNLNTARKAGMGAGKLSTSAILAGGETPPSGHGVVETYDGTSYTEVADLNDARGMGASDGTQTAAIVAGGTSPGEDADTEIWDGSSWTEVANLNSARYGQAGAGTTTSLVAYGGYLPSPGYTGFTESWDGTSWTEVADLNTKKYLPGRAGTSNTDAFAFGGLTPPPTATAETWNGTSWTEVGDLNTARYGLGGCGLTTFAIAFGGEATKTETEAWNGTSWTEINEMASGRRDVGMAGSAVSGLCMGGDNGSPPAGTAVTEEFNATAGLANITVS